MEGGATHSCVHHPWGTPMNVRLHHLGLGVSDVEATTEALIVALGAEPVPSPDTGHPLLRLGGVLLALVPLQDSDPTNRAWGDHIALASSEGDRKAAVARLTERGWSTLDVRGRVYARSPDGAFTIELLAE